MKVFIQSKISSRENNYRVFTDTRDIQAPAAHMGIIISTNYNRLKQKKQQQQKTRTYGEGRLRQQRGAESMAGLFHCFCNGSCLQ